jgi:large repetitive protein
MIPALAEPFSRIGISKLRNNCTTTEDGATCSFALALCLTLEGSCKTYLYKSDVFDAGFSYVEVSLNITNSAELQFYSDTITDKYVTRTSLTTTTYTYRWTGGTGPYFKNVTVQGVRDYKIDGTKKLTVTWTALAADSDGVTTSFSSSQYYNKRIWVSNTDTDNAYIIVNSATCTQGQEFTENGGTCTITVKIAAAAVGGMSVDLLLNVNMRGTNTIAFCTNTACTTYSQNYTLSFTQAGFNTSKTIKLRSLDDSEYQNGGYYGTNLTINTYETTGAYKIVTQDTAFKAKAKLYWVQNRRASDAITFYVQDNEIYGFAVTQNFGYPALGVCQPTDENGAWRQLEVGLNVMPTSPVFVPITVSDSSVLYTTRSKLTFVADNYSLAYVYYYGVDNLKMDGTKNASITLGPLETADSRFSSTKGKVTVLYVTVYDNDVVSVKETECTTNEDRTKICSVNISIDLGRWPTSSYYSTDYFSIIANVTEPLEAEFTGQYLTGTYSKTAYEPLVQEFNSTDNYLRIYFLSEGWVVLYVIGVDDLWDDGPQDYNITVKAFSEHLYAEYTDGEADAWTIVNISKPILSYALNSTNLDNDTAGIVVYQSNSYFYNYKVSHRDTTDYTDADRIILPKNYTTEWGGTTTFYMHLTSRPLADVYIYITTRAENPNGGDSRFEGYPLQQGRSYSYRPVYKATTSPYIGLYGKESGTISNAGGYTLWSFSPDNYTQPIAVKVKGLDDFVDDYNVPYYLFFKFRSADANYQRYANNLTLPLMNKDDDMAGWTVTATSTCSPCKFYPGYSVTSESYYGYVGYVNITLHTEPKDTLLITVTSTDPTHAIPDATLVVISRFDWMNPSIVTIRSVENSVKVSTRRLFRPQDEAW